MVGDKSKPSANSLLPCARFGPKPVWKLYKGSKGPFLNITCKGLVKSWAWSLIRNGKKQWISLRDTAV
jgi:hypothetical protein